MLWQTHAYLMIDSAIVAEESNTSMVREQAYKHPDPIMRLDDVALTLGGRVGSFGYHFVVREGGTFRMWYQVRGVREAIGIPEPICENAVASSKSENYDKGSFMAYAESDDGIHFHPVRVGAVELDGSRDNNLVRFDLGGEGQVRQCGFLHDPLDQEWPFKCLYNRPARGSELETGALAKYPDLAKRDWWVVWGIGRSKDGFNWQAPRHKHTLVAANPEHARLFRSLDGGLVMADQMMSTISDWQYRNVKGWITYDQETAHRIPDHLFRMPEHMVRCYSHFTGPNWADGTPWVQPHIGLVVGRKGPTLVALNGYLYGCAGREPGAETYAQVADIGLSVSNGLRFFEVWPFRPFITRGERDAWNYGMVAQNVMIEDDERTLFYITGGDVGNLSSTYLPGLAWIPRDRFGYRILRGYRDTHGGPREGRITLKPAVLPDKPAMAVNCSNVTDMRAITLELADESGNAIPGYSFDDCQPVVRDGLKQPVVWKGGKTAAELSGRTVQMRARLFSSDCGAVYHGSPRLYAIYTA